MAHDLDVSGLGSGHDELSTVPGIRRQRLISPSVDAPPPDLGYLGWINIWYHMKDIGGFARSNVASDLVALVRPQAAQAALEGSSVPGMKTWTELRLLVMLDMVP